MADPSERVTVRIPAELLERLKAVQAARGLPTVSDSIREGLERYVEMTLPPPNIRKVVVDLSRRDNQELEALVREGSSVSVDDAVRAAVREYIGRRLAEIGAAARVRRGAPPLVAAGGAPSP